MWIFPVTNVDSRQFVIVLLVDSGAFDHVCPRDFFPEVPMVPSPLVLDCHGPAPMGAILVGHYGEKRVLLRLVNGRKVTITFQVLGVSRPILSAMKLRNRGYSTVIGAQPYLARGLERVPLVVHAGL